MSDTQGKDGRFLPGKSGNPRGRPPGVPDRRRKMTESILNDLEAILNVVKARAADGDMQAASLLLARTLPTVKAEGERLQFEFDATLSPSHQLQQIAQAVADGDLTLDQGKGFAELVRQIAEVKALDGQGDKADKLINAFKQLAQTLPN